MRLTIGNLDDGGYVRVRCSGTIAQAEFGGVNDPLAGLLGEGAYTKKVLLDLEKTTYIDSSGIGYLISVHKRFLAAGGEMVLCNIPPSVMQVFQLLQMNRVFRMRP